MFSGLQITDIPLNVIYNRGIYHVVSHFVIGAYQPVIEPNQDIMVLYRALDDAFQGTRDSICKLYPRKGMVKIGDWNEYDYILDEDWETFDKLRADQQFRLGGETWRKMAQLEIRQIVKDLTFTSM